MEIYSIGCGRVFVLIIFFFVIIIIQHAAAHEEKYPQDAVWIFFVFIRPKLKTELN
jgi:hypothetical protein